MSIPVQPDYLNGAAQAIGSQLADSAVSAAGSFVVGQLLSAIGLDTDPQAEIQAELSQILAGINQLEQDVAALKQDMDAAMSQLQYSVIESRIQPFVDKNDALNGLFTDLATATTSDDLAHCKAAILLVLDETITGAPSAWSNALGSDGSPTNLIQAWSQVVYLHYTFFGADASHALATHWAYLDAQQAQSVMYCVEWLNQNSDHAGALRTLKQWRTNRTAQLALLRGMPYATDTFTYIKSDPDDPASGPVSTAVLQLPTDIVITDISGAPMMYMLPLMGPIRRGDGPGFDQFDLSYILSAINLAKRTPFPMQPPLTNISTSWGVPNQEVLVEFLNKCGGSVGGGGADQFATALGHQGFTFFPDQQLRLWTDINRNADGSAVKYIAGPGFPGMPEPYRSIFVDGESWWNPSTNPDDSACLLFQRRLQPGESDNYWYS